VFLTSGLLQEGGDRIDLALRNLVAALMQEGFDRHPLRLEVGDQKLCERQRADRVALSCRDQRRKGAKPRL
jgi:hypothetical protein